MSASPERPIFALFDSLAAQPVKAGTRLTAPVTQVTEDFVIVALEGAEGRLPISEVAGSPKAGDALDVYVEEVTEEGDILLSSEKAARLALHDRLEQAVTSGEQVTATLLAATRGGLAVSVLGVKAFLPQNRMGGHPGPLADWIGREMPVKILTLDGFKGRIEVGTTAAPVAAPTEADQDRRLAEIKPGDLLDGQITRLAKFGAFVDLGGVEGLIGLGELDWGRPQHPRDAVSPGETVRVQVLDVDLERRRVGLSRKAALPDPWAAVVERYPAGTRASGTVVGLTDYGAFVAVAPGVEGLVHLSEIQWGAAPKNPGAALRAGQQVDVEVIDVDIERKRLRLSIKRTAANPWQVVREKYTPGTRLRAPVRSVTDFGVFVAIEEGLDGLVHVSDMEWGQTVRDPQARFHKGDIIEVMVLHIDAERQRLSLGIKQLTEDKRPAMYARIEVGQVLTGTIARVVDFGIFVLLPEGLEGLMHRSAVGGPLDAFSEGQELEVRVLSVDAEAGRIALSRPGVEAAPAEPAAEQAEQAAGPTEQAE